MGGDKIVLLDGAGANGGGAAANGLLSMIPGMFANLIGGNKIIETFETMQDIYSDNYRLKVYTGNCIIQLNANPKDPSKSFFDVYDRDEMKLIYGIKISILKEMFGICI